jgi:transposase
MDYHQNARLTLRSREQLARKVLLEKATLKLAAASFNVSPKTAAKWVRRYQEQGLAGLRDRSSRPHCSPRQTSSSLSERVLHRKRLTNPPVNSV